MPVENVVRASAFFFWSPLVSWQKPKRLVRLFEPMGKFQSLEKKNSLLGEKEISWTRWQRSMGEVTHSLSQLVTMFQGLRSSWATIRR